MTSLSRAWAYAFAASLALHAGAFAVIAVPETAMQEHMAGGAVSLADSLPSVLEVEGVPDAVEVTEPTLDAVTPEEAVPPPPDQAIQPTPAEPTQPAAVEPVDPAQVADATPPEAAAAQPSPSDLPEPIEAIDPQQPVAPAQTVEAAEIAPVETVIALSPVPNPRPKPEPAQRERQAKPDPRKAERERAQRQRAERERAERQRRERQRAERQRREQAQRGNARRDRSTAEGGRSSRQRQAGNAGRRATQGNFNRANYAGRVLAHLRRHMRYPRAARNAGIQGRAVVRFTINASGTVTRVSLARSSGNRTLDSEALAMVRRASRFPPIPRNAGRRSMSFTAPINYRLR